MTAARAKGHPVRTGAVAAQAPVAMAAEVLEAILANLLENACQHGDGRVEVSLRDQGGRWTLEVADAGPGLDPRLDGRAFEPFVTGAAGRGGTGLGRAIVRALAEAHDGTAGAIHFEVRAARRKRPIGFDAQSMPA